MIILANNNRFQHREVIVTRNFVDALVSGYLYHKSGAECTRDLVGRELVVPPPGVGDNDAGDGSSKKKTKTFLLQNLRWEMTLNRQKPGTPWRNRTRLSAMRVVAGRNICQYLQDEPDDVGMRAYADFALGYWYAPYYVFWELTQSLQDPRQPSVMFVCYENLANPQTKRSEVHKIMDWMFPTGWYDGRADPPPPNNNNKTAASSWYEGGHATNHDPKVRRRLRRIVEKLDEELFQHWIARANKAFGCESTIN